MKSSDRTEKTIKNISTSLIYQVINLVTNFILRTVFIRKLGIEILGVNGLFSNILSVLSLADLGINTAMMFSLYKPLAENDINKISAYMSYYKKIYRIIACTIFSLGILVVPFLKYIVNTDIGIDSIILYYILYLINSVVSYLAVYKTIIVIADQKEYKLKIIDGISLLIKFLIQIITLIVLENYIVYLVNQIMITVLTNVIKTILSNRMYSLKNEEKLNDNEKKSIWKNVKSLFLYQVGNVILNNTDNILISIMLGTTIVGLYSNYTLIITALTGVIAMIFSALQSSIGNFNISSNSEQKFNLYKVILMCSDILFSFCSICLVCLLNPFISVWIGEKFAFNISTVIIIGFNFYVMGMLYPNWCYRFTTDLFNRAKWVMMVASLLNVVLSILLGKLMKLDGILLATALARLLSTFWYEAKILYMDYFKQNFVKFIYVEIKNLIFMSLICIAVYSVTTLISNQNIMYVIFKFIITIFLTLVIYLIKYYRSKEFIYLKNKFIKQKA